MRCEARASSSIAYPMSQDAVISKLARPHWRKIRYKYRVQNTGLMVNRFENVDIVLIGYAI